MLRQRLRLVGGEFNATNRASFAMETHAPPMAMRACSLAACGRAQPQAGAFYLIYPNTPRPSAPICGTDHAAFAVI